MSEMRHTLDVVALTQATLDLQDVLASEEERTRVTAVLRQLLADPKHGPAIRADLHGSLSASPIWMQRFVRLLLLDKAACP